MNDGQRSDSGGARGTRGAASSDHKAAEEALRLEKQSTDMALDAQLDTFFVFEPETGKPIRWNRAFREMSGYTDDEIAGMKVPDDWYDAEDLAKAADATRELLAGGTSTMEMSLITKDGRRVPTEYRASTVPDDSGKPTRIIAIGRDIAERRRTERLRAAHLRLVGFGADHSIAETLREFVDEAEALTGSQIGFFHFVEENGETLALQTWSTNTQERMCTAEGAGVHYPVAEAGVWVDCVHERRSIVHNDYASLPHKKGLPEGHVPVVRELVVPVIRGCRIVAILGVGNKLTDYDDADVEAVQRLAEAGWEIVERQRAEEALRESEARYRTLVENIPGVVWASRRDGHTRYISPNVEKVYGFSVDEIYDRGEELWFGRIHPDDVEQVKAAWERVFAEGSAFEIEYRVQHQDGHWIWLRDRSAGASDVDPEGLVYGVFWDVTETRLAERALIESERRYRTLFERMPVVCFAFDQEGRFLDWNQEAQRVYGYTRDEAIGASAYDLIVTPQTKEATDQVIAEVFSGESIVGAEWQDRNKHGEVGWRMGTAFPLLCAEGSVEVGVNLNVDITERKRAEAALRESEEKSATAFRASPVMMTLSELSTGKLLEVNQAFEDITGYGRAEALGRTTVELGLFRNPADRGRIVDEIRQHGRIRSYDLAGATSSGEPRTLRYSGELIQLGSQRCLISALEDVTEQRRAEQELRSTHFAIEHAAEGVLYVDPNARVRFANDEMCRQLGYSRDELLGLTVHDFAPEYTRKVWPEFWERVQRDGHVAFETPHLRKDGSSYPSEVSVFLVDFEGQKSMWAFCRDITERKRAEQKLEGAFEEIRRLKEKLEAENLVLREEIEASQLHGNMVAESEAMRAVLGDAEQVAQTDSTVLILGETGTGKELLARAIHQMSRRRDKQIVFVNCAAMPAALIEGELFGREKGAFTGALTRQAGRFEAADGSTIFLDEVGELSAEAQAKLLRVLQEGQFERLGSPTTHDVDVRVIAATNRDLEQEVAAGRFRSDLFYRLNVFPLTVPPLRHRSDDIAPLVWAFVAELGRKMGKTIERIPDDSLQALRSYPWPGNARELRNLVERAMILCRGTTLRVEPPRRGASGGAPELGSLTLDELQRRHIIEVLEQTRWRVRGKGGAAELLGLKPSTLESRLTKLGIRRP